MTDYLDSRKKALQQHDVAFHIFNVTFPLIKDPKLLIGVMQNIMNSFEYSIDTILAYERELHLISVAPQEFQAKFNLFKFKSRRRNNIPVELTKTIDEIQETLDLHKESPMVFQRGNKFVICSNNYMLKTISINDIREYLTKNMEFIRLVDNIVKFNR